MCRMPGFSAAELTSAFELKLIHVTVLSLVETNGKSEQFFVKYLTSGLVLSLLKYLNDPKFSDR